MLEDETIACPVCDNDLHTKVIRSGKSPTYIVPENCPKCNTSSSKLEKMLGRVNTKIKTQRSYIKVDPRG